MEELVAVTLAFTVLGMAGLTLLYNEMYKIKPKITPHNYVCDDEMHIVQWWIQGREPGGSFPPFTFRPNYGPKDQNNFGGGPPPLPLSKGLDDWASTLSQGLDPALLCAF